MPRLDKIYTKTGDEGTTGLGGGQRVPKDSRRVVTYGTVDELNSQIGVALATGLCERLTTELTVIQNELFDLGSDLCWPSDDPRRARIPTVEARHVAKLERLIDEFNDVVGELTNFLLPGGAPGAAQLHVARTVCRRAEREAVRLGRDEAIGEFVLPTSTASRTRSSSWLATRTTSGASPNRSGSRAPDRRVSPRRAPASRTRHRRGASPGPTHPARTACGM
jgi:cob(I)alamin adenosyltransferase